MMPANFSSSVSCAWCLCGAFVIAAPASRALEAQPTPTPQTLKGYYIASRSMLNTLRPNDRIVVDLAAYQAREPRVGEIVVFKAPARVRDEPGAHWIQRCVGVPGQVVFTRGRKLFRDGREVREPYARWSPGYVYAYDMKIVGGLVFSREYLTPGLPGVWTLAGVPLPEREQRRITRAQPGKIPAGKLLLLGDNRNLSNDSHLLGLVSRADLVGRATLIFWPLTHARSL